MSKEPSSTLPRAGAEDVLYVLDLSNFVFRAYHALPPLTAPNGEPTNATLGTMNMFHRMLDAQRPALLAVTMDSRGRGFRGQLSPDYKAHRPPAPEDLVVQMARCRELFEAYRVPVFQRDGFEADDVIATLVKQARAAGLRVVIASSDKDLYQLVDGDRVVVWDAMRSKVYGPPEVHEKFGVAPSRVRDLLALVGDTSDNVPGVPGVGPKTAAQLLARFGSVSEVMARASEVEKPKLRKSLEDSVAAVELAYRLVELRDDVDVAIDVDALRFGRPDVTRLRALFTELHFQRLLEGLPREDVVASPNTPAPHEASATATPRSTPAPVTTVLDLDALEALAREARAAGQLAVAAVAPGVEPMRTVLTGLALAVRDDAPCYVPLGHRTLTAPKQLPLDEVRRVLGPLLVDPSVAKLGHDVKFTQVLLARYGLPITGVGFDAVLAGYLLDPEASHALDQLVRRELGRELVSLPKAERGARGPKYGVDELEVDAVAPHAGSLVESVLGLAASMRPRLVEAGLSKLHDGLELPLADVLAEMESRGVLVAPELLGILGAELSRELETLERAAYAAAGHELNLASPKQLEAVLYDELGLPAGKKTRTGRSTDAEALEAIADAHPLPRLVLEHRALAKLKGTYVDTLPTLVLRETGRIHTRWEQAVAATGRISSREPNLQNIPVRSEHGKRIREAFVAPEGALLLSADYSQIELRVLAHLSRDPVLVEAFSLGQDVHVRTAMEVFDVAETEVTFEMRAQSKTVNFGVIYGMGAVALAKRLGIPRADAKRFIDAYFERYRGVREYLEGTLREAQETGEVRTLLGRRRLLPELRSGNPMQRSYAERIAQNTPIQGTAADLLKLAMVTLREPVVPGARMVLTVHDELVFEVPEGAIDEAAGKVRRAMESVAELSVPLVVDVGWGKSWALAH
ncbi:MAG: DNA polymerase I [Deltaproteobacteria bacterium]|nr:DNA polymerase I [Deltaproteobacteria bacterium]